MMGDDEMIVDLGPKQLRCEIAKLDTSSSVSFYQVVPRIDSSAERTW